MQIATTHTNTDFDALASLVAATFLYPGTLGLLPGQVRPNVKAFLALHQDLFHIVPRKGFDLAAARKLIVVDANSWKRLDRMQELAGRDVEIHVWDHHMEGANIEADVERRRELGANVTQMVQEMQKRDCAISPMHATLFLLGIYEDTGNLTYPSATPLDAAMTGFLLENGADLNVASAYLSSAFDHDQTEILTSMLARDEVVSIAGFQVAVCSVDTPCGSTMLAPVVTKYLEIKGADAVFGIFRLDDHCSIVIARSGHRDMNVGGVIKSLGGGGHPAAGSAMIKSGDVQELHDRVCTLVGNLDRPDTTVAGIMSHPAPCISPDTKLNQVSEMIRNHGRHAFLVEQDGMCLGMIGTVEMSKVRTESQLASPITSIMRRNLPSIAPDRSLQEALLTLSDSGLPLLPVIQDGRLVGKVTRTDLMLQIYDLECPALNTRQHQKK